MRFSFNVSRIGRKKTLVLAVLLSAVMGISRSLAWSYMSFLAFEFLDPLCGSGLYTAGFVLGMYQYANSAHFLFIKLCI
jgi:hypothetical protein